MRCIADFVLLRHLNVESMLNALSHAVQNRGPLPCLMTRVMSDGGLPPKTCAG